MTTRPAFAAPMPFTTRIRPIATVPRVSSNASARLCSKVERENASGGRLDALVYISLAIVGLVWPAWECVRAINAF